MVKKSSKLSVILTLLLIALLVILLMSACDTISIGGSQETPVGPPSPAILAPVPVAGETMVKVLRYSPVQIQSSHSGQNISRVELHVQKPGQASGDLLRSDVPENGVVTQEWIPQQAGEHLITLKTFYTNDQPPKTLTTSIQVLESQAVAVAAVAAAGEQPTTEVEPGQEFPPPTPTPQPGLTPVSEIADAQIAVVSAELEPTTEATPERHYPPPPPAPGVPYGPTQTELPSFGPPVCDAAQSIGVYSADTSRRVMVIEPDDVPARAVGGTTVHRGWRLQNIGTCTWGPGYELAFYGGRAMGSGGVAFESLFPTDPGRRNALVDQNRLVVPEGKPNQTAVLEVLLNVPVTPGIHQSYWRMRNPHGVYFGPIVGVTFEVVRECQHGVYGAPAINKFEILGVGNVYKPDDPVSVIGKLGDAITLEYNVTNATNFDIVIEDPTGNIQSTSTPDPSGRISFTPKTLGRHVVTLYADNGSCTVPAQVFVEVIPPDGEQFRLDIIAASCATKISAAYVPTNSVRVEWNHYNQDVDQVTLVAELYRRTYAEYCPIVDNIFGWKGHCYMTWNWERVSPQPVPPLGLGVNEAQGAAVVTNLEQRLCPASVSATEQYGIRYVARAQINGRAAAPEFSNTVDCICSSSPSTLPTELDASGAGEFNPVN
ncbi:MAG: hypothetical protein JW953_11255 [Anaerolineae bacterium]|nr:hypothetical protein [Anaerolineae bacterium]